MKSDGTGAEFNCYDQQAPGQKKTKVVNADKKKKTAPGKAKQETTFENEQRK
jgi:hypothetical protein